jgi:glycosyltransferase involved in cell wall biosynthesis
MNMPRARASVIIRTKDSAGTIAGVLSAVRSQSVASEIIVVDSGSSDETLAIAHARADRVIEMPAASFSFGRALNVGAASASAPNHFALSSHSFPPDDRWIERSLSHYEQPDVAGTSGALSPPGLRVPLTSTFHQTLTDALERPWWGFSNTGSSWRAQVWREFPFDEALLACEDKEWGFRVLAAGWTIAFDPQLCTSTRHREAHGVGDLYRRSRREFQAIGSFAALAEPTVADLLREWFRDISVHGCYRRWRRRLSPLRLAGLAGKYHGIKAVRRPTI